MQVSSIVLLFATAAGIFAQAPAEPQFEGSMGIASYSGGYILDWDSPAYNSVTIYGPDTKVAYSSSLREDRHLEYLVWAVDSDGIAARAYTLRDGNDQQGRIDLLDSAGKPIRTINTGAYTPQYLTFAPDHSIWSVGYDMLYTHESASGLPSEGFNVLHHYSRSGQEIGQGLPWAQIAGDYNAQTSLQLCIGGKFLFATNDRIAFLSTLKTGHNTWLEISPSGNLLGQYELGDFRILCYNPVAMTSSGEVYAAIFREDRFDGWAVLDRSKNQWRKVGGYPEGRIIGSDGDNVIFSQHDGGWTVLHSIAATSLKVAPKEQQVATVAQQD